MKKINQILKQISLLGAGLLLNANVNAQQLHGTIKLASDGITPVENAQIKIWHKYTTGNTIDTLHLTTDANGEYYFNPFKIHVDPDSIISNVSKVNTKTIENVIITNNPGQGHQFIFSSNFEPKGAGEIYNLKGQKVAEVKTTYDEGKYISSWNGNTPQGLATEGVYIYSQILENGKRKTQKFIQVNDGTQSNYSLEKIIENPKSSTIKEKSTQNTLQATYLFEIKSILGTSNPAFIDKTDTIIFSPISEVSDFYADHLVDGIPNHRDVQVIIREDYDTLRLENVMVKMRDDNTGLIVDSSLTDANGVAIINNVPLGTVFRLEYGNEVSLNNRPDYLSRIDTKLDSIVGVNTTFADTIESVIRQRTLPKKWLTVPKRAGDTSPDSVNIGGNSNWLTEVITDSVNIEAAKGRDINIYVNPQSYEVYFDDEYLTPNDGMFFPTSADEPWNFVATQPNITSTMEANYDENSNFYSGQLGDYINLYGSSQVYMNQKEGTLNDGKTGILGFDLDIEAGTNNGQLFQENFYAKQFGFPTQSLPSGRTSLFNGNADANYVDRALFWTVYKHKQNIYKNEIDTEDYRNVQENL